MERSLLSQGRRVPLDLSPGDPAPVVHDESDGLTHHHPRAQGAEEGPRGAGIPGQPHEGREPLPVGRPGHEDQPPDPPHLPLVTQTQDREEGHGSAEGMAHQGDPLKPAPADQGAHQVGLVFRGVAAVAGLRRPPGPVPSGPAKGASTSN